LATRIGLPYRVDELSDAPASAVVLKEQVEDDPFDAAGARGLGMRLRCVGSVAIPSVDVAAHEVAVFGAV
jgi:hypothetical protein